MKLISAAFILIWSTGFIGAAFGLPYAGPFTFLSWRFLFVTITLLIISWVLKSKWPSIKIFSHLVLTGILMHGIYLGGVFLVIDWGLGATATGIVVGLQPILTAIFASLVLGEKLEKQIFIGLFLGLLGMGLAVGEKIVLSDVTPMAFLICIVAVTAIAFSTVYQKKYCSDVNIFVGGTIQFAAAGVFVAIIAFIMGDRPVMWHMTFSFTMIWMVLVLSVGGVSLLFLLIKKGAAHKVGSLFYMIPGVTALMAWGLLGESINIWIVSGLVCSSFGVWLVNRPHPRDPGCCRR